MLESFCRSFYSGDIRPSLSIALIVFEANGAAGRNVRSPFEIGAGISASDASGGIDPYRNSKAGNASRLIMLRKMASMTVVVRLHRLSRPLRRMVARIGESM